ncbi:MAG TPA: hypothetical protein VGM33_10275 [Baekduia sp.]|jgi:hypothetical protein
MHARKPVLAALALAAAFALPAGAGAATHSSHDCPAKPGTLIVKPLGRVWHTSTTLYGCTSVYGQRPKTVRLGKWAKQSRVAFDGVKAAWTLPLTRDGVRSDRAWIASAEDGKRWLLGSPLVPASGSAPAREARIEAITVVDESAAWVTRTGEVVFALHSPEDDPTPIGTPPGPLAPTDHLLLVGAWPAVAPSDLVATLKLTEGDGDGDECGGSNDYLLTVRPGATAEATGATWQGGWERPHCG